MARRPRPRCARRSWPRKAPNSPTATATARSAACARAMWMPSSSCRLDMARGSRPVRLARVRRRPSSCTPTPRGPTSWPRSTRPSGRSSGSSTSVGGRRSSPCRRRRCRPRTSTSSATSCPACSASRSCRSGIFAAIPLVADREKLILKRLAATPLQRWQLVGSNVLMRLLIALVQSVIIIGVGVVVFGVVITGPFALSIVFVVAGRGRVPGARVRRRLVREDRGFRPTG